MTRKAWLYLWGVAVVLCAMTACNPNSADLPIAQPKKGSLAFFNLIPYSNPINFYVNGTRINFNKIGFDEYSGYLSVPSGEQSIVFKSDSLRANLFDPVTLKLDSNKTTIFVTGNSASALIMAKDTALADRKNYKPKLRFINASAGSPSYDLSLNNVTINNISYKTISNFARVDTSKLTIQLKPAGGSSALIVTTIKLQPNSVYTMFVYGAYNLTSVSNLNLGIIVNN